jgi:hypothetical protein
MTTPGPHHHNAAGLAPLDHEPERPRDWEFEGDLAGLAADCEADRALTGCTSHAYRQHTPARLHVWRIWE